MALLSGSLANPLAVNASTTETRSLGLNVFGGEVILNFRQSATAMQNTWVKPLPPGAKAAQFPVLGQTTASYHTPGESTYTDQDAGSSNYTKTIRGGARYISPDLRLIAQTFVDDLDSMINFYDERSAFAYELSDALVQTIDPNIFRLIGKGAAVAADALFTGSKAGAYSNAIANADTSASVLEGQIRLMAIGMDNNHIPETDRFIALRPTQIDLLLNDSNTRHLVSNDYNNTTNADIATRKFDMIHGFHIIKTTNLPSNNQATNYNQPATTNANEKNDYTFDATDLVALGWWWRSIGTCMVSQPMTSAIYEHEYRGWFLGADVFTGSDILRPEGCGAIFTT